MRAVVFDKALAFNPHRAEPVAQPGECLVRVHLAGICSTDIQITRGYLGFRGVLGHEFVGTVEQGPDDWRGRRVAGEINCVCGKCGLCQAGLSSHCPQRTVLGIVGRDGAFADLVALPARNLHAVPAALSDEEAVFIEPLAAAWQVVKQVRIDPRMQVAVLGTGRLGLLVAQVLGTLDCKLEVIGRNPYTLALCERRHLRATHVESVPRRNDRDVVVDCTGSPDGLALALQLVRPRGTIVLKSTYAGAANVDLAPAVIHEVTILGSRCGPFAEAIASLERRELDVRALVSKIFPIERAVEAFAAAEDPANVKVLLKINPRTEPRP